MIENKPTIYNAPSIYKLGESGGGGGNTGIIYNFDFIDGTSHIDGNYLVPDVGEKLYLKYSGITLTLNSNGLCLTSSMSENYCRSFSFFGYNGKKLIFSQKILGLNSGSWSQLGFILLGLCNNNVMNRGFGVCVTDDLFGLGSLLNDFERSWQFSDDINGGYNFIVPANRLYPTASKVIDSKCEFDFSNKTITYFINNDACFSASNIPEEIFYRHLGYYSYFYTEYGGTQLALQKLKIECE